MPTPEQQAALVEFDRTIQECLAYFDGTAVPPGRIGDWDARQLLAHFYYWHYATAWGIASAMQGGPPWPVATEGPDGVNSAAVELLAQDDVETVVEDLRRIQRRLVRVAAMAPDWDVIAFQRKNGPSLSIAQRIEGIANHWRNHLTELKGSGVFS
jgi:hypothetical protein